MSLGLGLSLASRSRRVVPNAPFAVLPALDAASKVVSAWILPHDDPDRDLTIASGKVTAWAAAYGTHKISMEQATAASQPSWDPTLYSAKGGVVFDGTDDQLTGAAAPTGWPGVGSDLYLLAAVRQDTASLGTKYALAYGASATSQNAIGRGGGGSSQYASGRAFQTLTEGSSLEVSGTRTIGFVIVSSGTCTLYVDGAADATTGTAGSSLTLTRVRIGAGSPATPVQFWNGAIVAAAVLNSTATLQDFLDLEAEFRGRLA